MFSKESTHNLQPVISIRYISKWKNQIISITTNYISNVIIILSNYVAFVVITIKSFFPHSSFIIKYVRGGAR